MGTGVQDGNWDRGGARRERGGAGCVGARGRGRRCGSRAVAHANERVVRGAVGVCGGGGNLWRCTRH